MFFEVDVYGRFEGWSIVRLSRPTRLRSMPRMIVGARLSQF